MFMIIGFGECGLLEFLSVIDSKLWSVGILWPVNGRGIVMVMGIIDGIIGFDIYFVCGFLSVWTCWRWLEM